MEIIEMKFKTMMLFSVSLLVSPMVWATPATDTLMAQYKSDGAATFDAERGKKAWTKEVKNAEGETGSCTTCHGNDLSKQGKHEKTKKVIEPMAHSVNADRYTDEKKIEKWFKRNCKEAWGRECTSQEKGDFLKYLLSL
jgi:cytochrome c553